MPELPDVELYVHLLRERLVGQTLVTTRIYNPFVLRSVDPPLSVLQGKSVVGLKRLGKRVVIAFEDHLFLVIHLMIAGRFRWNDGAVEFKLGGKIAMAALRFANGTLLLTEAGSKKRASIVLVRGEAALASHDPGGIDVLSCTFEQFCSALVSENHSVKDVLTNPHVFSGIGNAYSDEILHHARLSPIKKTRALTEIEIRTLFNSVVSVLRTWTDKLQSQFANRFPGAGDITAFRPDFAVHGRYGQPCPDCGKPVQRIQFAENELNYCAECQNGGRVLADRSLSRLLKGDFPRSLD